MMSKTLIIITVLFPLLFLGGTNQKKAKNDILADTVIQSEILLKNAEKYAAMKIEQPEKDSVQRKKFPSYLKSYHTAPN